MSVGLNLKHYREQKNWNIDEFAQRVGIPSAECEKIEAGLRLISSAEIMKICSVLEISIDALFAEPKIVQTQPHVPQNKEDTTDIPDEEGSVAIPLGKLEALLKEMKGE